MSWCVRERRGKRGKGGGEREDRARANDEKAWNDREHLELLARLRERTRRRDEGRWSGERVLTVRNGGRREKARGGRGVLWVLRLS